MYRFYFTVATLLLAAQPVGAAKVTTLLREARRAQRGGDCLQALRLYRRVGHFVREKTLRRSISQHMKRCRGTISRRLRRLGNKFARLAQYDRALRLLSRALRLLPRHQRPALQRKIERVRELKRRRQLRRAVLKGDCDRIVALLRRPHAPRREDPAGKALLGRALLHAQRTAAHIKEASCFAHLGRTRRALKIYRTELPTVTATDDRDGLRRRIRLLEKRLKAKRVTPRSIVLKKSPPAPSVTYRTPPSRRSPYRIAAWGNLGAGLALVGLGVTFAVISKNALNSAHQLKNRTPPEQQDRLFTDTYNAKIRRANRFTALQITFNAVGGAALIASITLFLLKPKKNRQDQRRWSIKPSVGRDGASLSAQLRF